MIQIARTYMLSCTVGAAKRELLADLRAAHLAHIINHQAEIIFGGVLGTADGPPEAICLVVRANSRDEAEAMARTDPYAQTYTEIRISEFQQRIPEAFPGQLAQVRDSFAAGPNRKDSTTALRQSETHE